MISHSTTLRSRFYTILPLIPEKVPFTTQEIRPPEWRGEERRLGILLAGLARRGYLELVGTVPHVVEYPTKTRTYDRKLYVATKKLIEMKRRFE